MASKLIFSSMLKFRYFGALKLIVILNQERTMAVIVIKNLEEKTLEVQDFSKSILQQIHGNGIDWMFTCGGKGKCTTCKAIVLRGIENLEPKTNFELKYESQGLLKEN